MACAALAARALGLDWRRGVSAWPASDPRVAVVQEGVIGNVVVPDVAPHVRPAPARKWEHLHDRASGQLVVLKQLRRRPGLGLVLPYGADPCVESREGALQRLDLANPAAAVGLGPVQRPGVGQWLALYEVEPVSSGERVLGGARLPGMGAGIHEHHGP